MLQPIQGWCLRRTSGTTRRRRRQASDRASPVVQTVCRYLQQAGRQPASMQRSLGHCVHGVRPPARQAVRGCCIECSQPASSGPARTHHHTSIIYSAAQAAESFSLCGLVIRRNSSSTMPCADGFPCSVGTAHEMQYS